MQEEHNIAIVKEALSALLRGDAATFAAMFTDDGSYRCMPDPKAFESEGPFHIEAHFEGEFSRLTFLQIEVLNIAAKADIVLCERLDRFVHLGRTIEQPVMSAIQIRDGRIAAWRDYFNGKTE